MENDFYCPIINWQVGADKLHKELLEWLISKQIIIDYSSLCPECHNKKEYCRCHSTAQQDQKIRTIPEGNSQDSGL